MIFFLVVVLARDPLEPLGITKALVIHLERAAGRHEPLLQEAKQA